MNCKAYKDYRRIAKPTARKMYNQGYVIELLPCFVSDSVMTKKLWISPVAISIKDSNYTENSFNREVRDFEYYNCNSELGYYAHYFVSIDDYFKYKQEVKNNATR